MMKIDEGMATVENLVSKTKESFQKFCDDEIIQQARNQLFELKNTFLKGRNRVELKNTKTVE